MELPASKTSINEKSYPLWCHRNWFGSLFSDRHGTRGCGGPQEMQMISVCATPIADRRFSFKVVHDAKYWSHFLCQLLIDLVTWVQVLSGKMWFIRWSFRMWFIRWSSTLKPVTLLNENVACLWLVCQVLESMVAQCQWDPNSLL